MRYYPFLCLNGTEVANADRVQAYIRNGLVDPDWQASLCYDCDVLNDGYPYISPASDDAPWFDMTIAESEEFFGIIPDRIDLLTVLGRSVQQSSSGGIVGPLTPKPRILSFTGQMVASSELGMTYGERWLNEVLSGSTDCTTGCSMDEALLLPACPSEDYDLGETYFRRMIDVGIIDGPVLNRVGNLPECKISSVSFQLVAGVPYLVGLEEACLPTTLLSLSSASPTCCMMSTTDWKGDAVAVITLTADFDATDIVLTGSPTFDGNCPPAGGEPCWTITIPSIPRDGVLVIDGVREQIFYTDPSLKVQKSGLSMVSFDGPLTFPVVSPCSDFCICAYAGSGQISMKVDKVVREL